jgi:hypothetical protein
MIRAPGNKQILLKMAYFSAPRITTASSVGKGREWVPEVC